MLYMYNKKGHYMNNLEKFMYIYIYKVYQEGNRQNNTITWISIARQRAYKHITATQ
jgi:hypothetical protein